MLIKRKILGTGIPCELIDRYFLTQQKIVIDHPEVKRYFSNKQTTLEFIILAFVNDTDYFINMAMVKEIEAKNNGK